MSRGTSFVAGLRDGLRAEWLAETGYESPIRNVSAAQMPLQPIARAAHDRHDSRVPLIAPPGDRVDDTQDALVVAALRRLWLAGSLEPRPLVAAFDGLDIGGARRAGRGVRRRPPVLGKVQTCPR